MRGRREESERAKFWTARTIDIMRFRVGVGSYKREACFMNAVAEMEGGARAWAWVVLSLGNESMVDWNECKGESSVVGRY